VAAAVAAAGLGAEELGFQLPSSQSSSSIDLPSSAHQVPIEWLVRFTTVNIFRRVDSASHVYKDTIFERHKYQK